MNEALLSYIHRSPTAFHAVATTAERLREAGFLPLAEGDAWSLQPGQGYYVTRNGSSLIAFRLPATGVRSFMITAAHCDSPCFKLRDRAELNSGEFVRLSVEGYGGMIWASWMDRPLSVAGRLLVKTEAGLDTVLVDMAEPLCLMPNVAIHMNRNMNKEANYNLAVDLQPLYGTKDSAGTFLGRVAAKAGVREEDIVTTDLFVYNPTPGVVWGDFLSAPRLDDLSCAFASLEALVTSAPGGAVPVCAIFDNEEVGSRTKQGAGSTFLGDTLTRLCAATGLSAEDYRRALAHSLMLSCDNAHALHPNHPEWADKNNAPVMNGGIVIKFNAAQRYTSDGVSAALFELICQKAGVPTQHYANRPDVPGGSTLGNISNMQVSLNTADVGLAQIAMHSAYETQGARDTDYLIRALRVFFQSSLTQTGDGSYTVDLE